MKSRMVLATMRAVSRRALPAVLGGLILLGGAAGVRADGRIAFTKVKAEDCEEGGSCEWRLRCQIGRQPMKEIFEGEVVGAGSVDVNKGFDVQTFPVGVGCTLYEDDGWFSTSWEEVGKGVLEVPGGGDYQIALGNEEEGSVVVHLSVDSLEVGSAPAPSAAPARGKAAAARQYLGVYEKLPGGRAVVVGVPWARLKARANQLAAKGSHLGMLETHLDGGQRLWSGIFYTGPEKSEIVSDLEWEPFSSRWKQLTDGGMRLMDLAIYEQGRKRLFTGVFHDGWDTESLWVGQSKDEFNRKWLELSGQGLRLMDLEHYRSDSGKRLYASAFRAGSGGYGLWTELDWSALQAKWKTASDGGTQIVDLEPYTEGGKRLFDAALHSGPKGTLEAPADWSAFARRWRELLGQGQRLVDLEAL